MDPLVCDLTVIMRARLLFGLYNKRVVPPGWQGFAKAYCLIISLTIITWMITCFRYLFMTSVWWLFLLPSLSQYTIAVFASIWTEDEYIYSFFTRNRITDMTVDSTTIFNRMKTQIKKTLTGVMVLFLIVYVLVTMFWYKNGVNALMTAMSIVVFDQCLAWSYTTKLLIMSLFSTRILILRRRLERYGFRTIGLAPPQPYCQIYDEILRGLDATDNPLKLLLFFDLINNSVLLIGDMYYFTNIMFSQFATVDTNFVLMLLIMASYLVRRCCFAYGHVAFLESAATHCDAMASFIAVQLIKTPTEQERTLMYRFLSALERRGARYHLLHALPLNARCVLTVIGFCTSQVIVLINMFQSNLHLDNETSFSGPLPVN